MLSKGKQEEFLNAEIKHIRLIIAHFNKNKPTKKPLHALRVSMKKIKSLAELSSFYNPVSKVYTAELKSIFKLAGEIRNGRIIIEQMSRYKINDNILRKYQKSAESNAIAKFFAKREHYLVQLDGYAQTIRKELKAIPDNTVLDFYTTQLHQVRQCMAHLPDSNLLHQCRRWIKHLIYLQKLLSPRLDKRISMDTNFMEQLQDLIGKWHNHEVLAEVLQDFNAGSSKDIKGIEARKKALISQIEKLWHSSTANELRASAAHQHVGEQSQRYRNVGK
jgi:CHAD domain-containing protein